jgi:hypothetical protein
MPTDSITDMDGFFDGTKTGHHTKALCQVHENHPTEFSAALVDLGHRVQAAFAAGFLIGDFQRTASGA